MLSTADLMYIGLVLVLNSLALTLGSLRKKKRREFSPLLILRKPEHIFLNNIVAYLPLLIPFIGIAYSLYIFYTSGRSLGSRILFKAYTLLELTSASILAYSGLLLLMFRVLDSVMLLVSAFILLALAAYTESRRLNRA